MNDRDFIDQDLVKPREEINRVKLGPADAPAVAEPGATSLPNRGVTELDLPVMARHRHHVDAQTAKATEELERLRRRHEDLEREKKDLEELRRKQSDYEKGKQELIERLNHSLISLERHEIKAAQLVDLLQNTRRRFREMQKTCSAINEDTWPEEAIREELGKALVTIDDARMAFNKAMSRVEAALNSETAVGGEHKPVIFDESPAQTAAEWSFGRLVWLGLAASLPLMLTLVVALILVLMHSAGWL